MDNAIFDTFFAVFMRFNRGIISLLRLLMIM
nr:MAG TPA: hypothetical protein [Caudoviricetes sp.]